MINTASIIQISGLNMYDVMLKFTDVMLQFGDVLLTLVSFSMVLQRVARNLTKSPNENKVKT